MYLFEKKIQKFSFQRGPVKMFRGPARMFPASPAVVLDGPGPYTKSIVVKCSF